MFRLALVTVLLPALVAGATVWAGRRLPAAVSRVMLAPALGLGYLVGHAGAAGLPPFLPVTSTQALFWLVALAVGVGMWEANGRERSDRFVAVARLVFVGLFLTLMVRSMVRYHWTLTESVLWIAALSVLLLLVWAALSRLHLATSPAAMRTAWCVSLAGTAIALALSHSALLGQLAGIMAAAVGGVLVVGSRSPGPSAAGVAVLLTVHAGLLVSGAFYADLALFRALALAVVPLGAVMANLRPWKNDLVRAVVVGVAIVILLVPVIVPLVSSEQTRMSVLRLSDDEARGLVSQSQCLPRAASSVGEALERGGYLRTLGGIDVYLAFRARASGASRAEVDSEAESLEIQIVPSVRGCLADPIPVPRARGARVGKR